MKKSDYYYWSTNRRKMLDILQERYKMFYKGVVLDIGGRDRGVFKKPRQNVQKWIFMDINEKYNPDVLLDVSNMGIIDSGSIDVINAIELFEHVKDIEKGLDECYRVLKEKGRIILSIPFLSYIHADPYDFQRWTHFKWKLELEKRGFKIEKFIIMGRYFSHLTENLKNLIKAIQRSGSLIGTLLMWFLNPFLDKISNLDNKKIVQRDNILKNYHTGYFIIATKE